VKKAGLSSAENVRRQRQLRAGAVAARPTEIDRAYLKEALGRRRSRSRAKAIRAAGLYALSREVVQSSQAQQARLRWQDADAHNWKKAWATPGIPPYGVVNEGPHDVGDVMEAMR
jgi:hypothetical protein